MSTDKVIQVIIDFILVLKKGRYIVELNLKSLKSYLFRLDLLMDALFKDNISKVFEFYPQSRTEAMVDFSLYFSLCSSKGQ